MPWNQLLKNTLLTTGLRKRWMGKQRLFGHAPLNQDEGDEAGGGEDKAHDDGRMAPRVGTPPHVIARRSRAVPPHHEDGSEDVDAFELLKKRALWAGKAKKEEYKP